MTVDGDGPSLDPEVMLEALLDPRTIEEAGPRAAELTKAMNDARVPGDARTFVGMALVLCAADAASGCPLGTERLARFVGILRTLVEMSAAQHRAETGGQ